MNMNRRILAKQAISVLATAGISGCAAITDIAEERPKKYLESVSSVLISEDGKKLVVMSEEFHYIFDAPPVLVLTLKGELHPYLLAEISPFRVGLDGRTVGRVALKLSDVPDEILEDAISKGFTRTEEGAKYDTLLEGKRYGANAVQPLPSYRLNKTYAVAVEVAQGAKVVKTPIYIAKGALVIAGVAVVLLAFATRLVFCPIDCRP
jgi:hypothetical protein